MADESEARPWEELEQIAATGTAEELEEFLDGLAAGEAARALARLSGEEQSRVLTVLEPEDAADLIEDIPGAQAVELIEQMEPEEAAAIVSEMLSNEQADLLAALDADDAEAVLAEMEPEISSPDNVPIKVPPAPMKVTAEPSIVPEKANSGFPGDATNVESVCDMQISKGPISGASSGKMVRSQKPLRSIGDTVRWKKTKF